MEQREGPKKTSVPLQALMKYALVMTLEASVESWGYTLAGWHTHVAPGRLGYRVKLTRGKKIDRKEGWTLRGKEKKKK